MPVVKTEIVPVESSEPWMDRYVRTDWVLNKDGSASPYRINYEVFHMAKYEAHRLALKIAAVGFGTVIDPHAGWPTIQFCSNPSCEKCDEWKNAIAAISAEQISEAEKALTADTDTGVHT